MGMVELVLTGPYTCISAEGCFAIQIEIPDDDAGSSTKDDSGPIEWEWDCYDPKYAAEVDKPPVTQLISDSVPSRKVAEVTYAVMSNAREATVQVVKFRLKDGQIAAGIGGEITALIDGFEDKYRSVLFWCAKGTRRYFSRTGDDDPWFLLELAGNVVAVPCGRVLHILVDLQVVTDDGKEVEVEVALCFDNGIWSKVTDDGKEVEVEVTWYPEIARSSKPPEQRISKEDDEEKFITALSEKSGPPELLKDKLIKEGSNSSSNISGPSMDCYPQSRPVTQQSEGAVYNRKLYMHQIFDGLDYNQVNIADLGQPHMFGCTNVHDYPIYDSLDPNANIVARAQGLHTETCLDYDNWFHWSRLVFSDERFEGSSFMAIGDQNKVTGEWAIVGGTGVFAFAQGTITICRAQDSGSSNIKEICIHALGFTGQATPIETPQNIKSFKDNMLNVDSKATSNACSPSMASPHSGPLTPQSQATEYIRTWYMHQIITGPDYNQVPIANPEKPEMFGYTYVHDYPIYDSLGPGKKIVARAQGLHSKTSMNNGGSWLHWSKVVFDYERFQGSSFNAIGNQEGEWAIVGGTGEFAFVQGTVTTRRVRESWPSNIKEIRIHAFCHPLTTPVETNNKIFEDGMIIIGSNAVSNVSSPMANTNPQSATVTPLSMRKYNRILYMHQIISGPDYNQVNIANPEQPEMFAYTNVHDYPIYDSLGPSKKLVARAQGLHTKTSMSYNGWFHWSSIVFTDERFQGSSLKTIGNQEGDWAIMGGTGAFTFAQGTVTTCRIQDTGFSNIKEIRIDALCCTPVNGVLP